MRFYSRLALSVVLALHVGAVAAEGGQYPVKPVRVLVGFPPSSVSDTIAQVIAEKMGRALRQNFAVEIMAGANGSLAATHVAHAPADGYVLLMGTNSINAINPSLLKSTPYDPARDFTPIGMVAEVPALLVARNDLPFSDLGGLVAYAKAHERGLDYASGTATAQVAGAMLKQKTGASLNNRHYDGEPPGLADLLAGQVDLMIVNIPIAYPYIKEGRIKAIAVLGPKRAAILPKIAAAGETVPGYAIPTGWIALFAPAGTPRSVVAKLNNALRDALQADDTRERVESTAGTSLVVSSPVQLAARVADDTRQWAEEIRAAGILPR
jgi:tripartite-type tricarboxylate transporter receptor subunit TctC